MNNPSENPKVSIITVVFNARSTLERTIQSVRSLDYSHVEYLVVDGGSTDGTLDIIRRYEAHINAWISEPDKGLYDAMNKGLNMATGDYVWFLNAGDEVAAPQVLTRLFEQRPGADIYYGDTMIVDLEGKEIGHRRLSPPRSLTWKDFHRGMLVSHQSILVARSLATPYDLRYRFSADYDWVLSALRRARVVVNGEMVLSRFLDGGLTKKNILPGLKERFKIMKKNFGLLATFFHHIPITCRFLRYLLIHRRF
ncbi:glycosyltransferase, group 2 family protein [Geofilum rubicundum JCM 15548]|uniref:Glycosyltransferase, group 2 family protein n=2 Tax=Geofilum TaxID=1236988 RepID=A0A0E9LWW0_9BACT|nr:glycosyltransferase, group 2 family protein [Geofilum rubicundum JCM 15548]